MLSKCLFCFGFQYYELVNILIYMLHGCYLVCPSMSVCVCVCVRAHSHVFVCVHVCACKYVYTGACAWCSQAHVIYMLLYVIVHKFGTEISRVYTSVFYDRMYIHVGFNMYVYMYICVGVFMKSKITCIGRSLNNCLDSLLCLVVNLNYTEPHLTTRTLKKKWTNKTKQKKSCLQE